MTIHHSHPVERTVRVGLKITGAVQGVGFRPLVFRLATGLGLTGFVVNNTQGVAIEVEGSASKVASFQKCLEGEFPPRAIVTGVEVTKIPLQASRDFVISQSQEAGSKTATVLPDIATCPDCLREIFDPNDRRYLYPFTNCTNCGPRYSIVLSLPYDRANTTMKFFTMCEQCAAEYANPLNRRFHAQPNACPHCGPHLEFWTPTGYTLGRNNSALNAAVEQISNGMIVAVKGLGGFQLVVDAENAEAILKLRERKRRSNKPFALMYPTIEMLSRDCDLTRCETDLILSAASPIVICKRKFARSTIAAGVAPGNPYLGVMLPYTPLHHILLTQLNRPVVATSGNLSEEPLCIDEREALRRLAGIADFLLVHNRPIHRHVDDSVGREIAGKPQIVRRARGYAPLPIDWQQQLPECVAVGGHLKNTVAISKGNRIYVSQHIGDLESAEAHQAFRVSISDLSRLYDLDPKYVAHDLHPNYSSTLYAATRRTKKVGVQHHYAHVLSCMVDNGVDTPLLGIAWDGTGYGLDRTIWGGEFLSVDDTEFERVAHFLPFPLPGGDAAAKEPRRSAAGALFELTDESFATWRNNLPAQNFTDGEAEVLWRMMKQGLNAPLTSSVGRLFDAVAALVGISSRCTFEGEGAMLLEFAIGNENTSSSYGFTLQEDEGRYQIDWRPMVTEIIAEHNVGIAVSLIAAKFHNTLSEIIVAVARRKQLRRVLLSGGCFQNKYLTERTIARLRVNGFLPFWHRQIPTNDGGIAVGQLVAIARKIRE